MSKLEAFIREAAQKYYQDGSSELSDEEFDNMVENLRTENPNSELLNTVGWGYLPESVYGSKFDHKYGLVGSLDKCRSWKELGSEYTSHLDLSLKLDGISVVLYYVEGNLELALTRGNGEVGIDITDKVKYLAPSSLDEKFTGGIRGEILMSYESFERFKCKHPEAKNPRNSTAGLVNKKEIEDIEYLDLIVYTIIGVEGYDSDLVGFQTIPMYNMRKKLVKMFGSERVVSYKSDVSFNNDFDFISKMSRCKDDWYMKYPADGIVITKSCKKSNSDSIIYDAKAYKFPSEIKETIVDHVEWNLRKSGILVPVVILKNPVELSGSTVQRASGFNAKYIMDNEIGEGSIINITKANEIIPYISKVISPGQLDLPDICPACKGILSWEGVHLKCQNPECNDKMLQDSLIWFNKLVPEDGLGDILIEQFLNDLVNNGVISNISVPSIMECIDKLPENTSQINLNKFNKCWNKLHGTCSFKLKECLQALNIPRLGDVTSSKLSNMYNDVEYIVFNSEVNHDIEANPQFWYNFSAKLGKANSVSIYENIEKMKLLKYIWNRISKPKSKEFKKVAITGKLSVKRSQFEKELKEFGYIVGDISKDTSYLITDDPLGNSSKNLKADTYNIPKISEANFRLMYM